MLGCLRGCLGKVALLVLVIVAAWAGWRWGPSVFPAVETWLGIAPPEATGEEGPSPELADSALLRVQALRREAPGDPQEVALDGRELTAILRYAVPGLVPVGMTEPRVELRDGRVRLRARVVLSSFPKIPDLGPVLGILPDTVDVEVEGALMPFGPGEAAFVVHGVDASRIPLPRRLIPELLRAMGRVDRPGLPPEAIALPLPQGLGAAYIRSDSLILSHDPS